MRLKTYIVKDMREALSKVRAELGEDAVIVASETAKDGSLLVRAAVDEKTEEASAAGVVTPAESETILKAFDDRYRDKLVAQLRAPVGRRDLAHARPFDRGVLLGILHRNRLPESLAPAIAEDAQRSELADLTLALAAALDKRMKLDTIDMRRSKAVLLAGSHGSGKTTVAAKLAAQARMMGRTVRLIATDTIGAGAMARLEAFAGHLDVDVFSAVTGEELASAIHLADQDNALLIADSASFDPRDHEGWRDFLAFSQVKGLKTVGVVSAAMDALEAFETAQSLSQLGAERLIVTGLDLARRKGALAALCVSGIAIAHVTQSPFLADDLEPLTPLGLARTLIAAAGADGAR